VHRGSSRRMARVVALLLLLFLPGLAMPGCGGGPLALTGGSIPIGVSRLQGVAVRADDIGRPISGASVVLSRGNQSGNTFTDSEGRFTFERIAGGNYLCTIFPPEGSGVQPWSFNIQFPEGARAQLLARMLPSGADPASIQGVRIVPEGYSLNVGESVRFSAQAFNLANDVLNIRGSLLLVGDVGHFDADGTLVATMPGEAMLVGWAGDHVKTVEVRVVP
jgi:hypothetical protein